MTRFVPVTVLVMLAASSVAHAQDSGLPGGAALTLTELKIHEDNSATAEFPAVDPDSEWHYFNLAHCQCAAPGISTKSGYHEDTFQYLIQVTNYSMAIPQPVDIYVGAECSNNTNRAMTCTKVDSIDTVDSIATLNGVRKDLSVFDLMAPTPKAGRGVADCARTSSTSSVGTVWLLVDPGGDGIPDYSVSLTNPIDTGPPIMPTALRARGGESAIELSWTPPADTIDIYGYQALCAKASDGTRGRTSGGPSTARYDTASTLCGATDAATAIELLSADDDGSGGATPDAGVDAATTDAGTPDAGTLDAGVDAGTSDAGTPDAAIIPLPDGLKNLDPTFLCGEVLTPTATSLRIGGLVNGVPYNVVLLAMDKFGNARGRYFASPITPVPSTDFWEDINGRDKDVKGGLCLLAETYGDDSGLTNGLRAFRDDTLGSAPGGRWLTQAYYATLGTLGGYVHGSIVARAVAGVVLAPLVALALLWHHLTGPGVLVLLALGWAWRRRRALPRWLGPTTAAASALVGVLALAPGSAHAGGYQPYWENPDITEHGSGAVADDTHLVTWLVGIRVGPYVPDIDRRFAGSPGPYKQMFGGYHLMVALDVDRVLWSGFGQLAVGLSAGYTQKTARSFTFDSGPETPMRPRATDENKFRMVPTALTASYHFTMLDDDYGIPIVPYARAGLSYYVWWISDASGIANVCADGSDKAANPSCSKDKALGASFGVQASIGLSIRAERIDASTANSMRQSGIQHAGIYGELSVAKVDGFGSDQKLSVGDRTWFAGVNFEF